MTVVQGGTPLPSLLPLDTTSTSTGQARSVTEQGNLLRPIGREVMLNATMAVLKESFGDRAAAAWLLRKTATGCTPVGVYPRSYHDHHGAYVQFCNALEAVSPISEGQANFSICEQQIEKLASTAPVITRFLREQVLPRIPERFFEPSPFF